MLLLLAATLAAAPHVTAVRPPAASSSCKRPTNYLARGGRYDGKPLQPRKLTELPPANMYVAVLRHDANGCEAPIVVKYNIGR